MKRTIALFLSLQLLLFCGCSAKSTVADTSSEHKKVEIILPQDDTVNGYRKKEKLTKTPGSIRVSDVSGESAGRAVAAASYFGNANSHIFHTPDCSSLKKTKSENRVSFSSRDDAIAAGYSPCKKCSP